MAARTQITPKMTKKSVIFIFFMWCLRKHIYNYGEIYQKSVRRFMDSWIQYCKRVIIRIYTFGREKKNKYKNVIVENKHTIGFERKRNIRWRFSVMTFQDKLTNVSSDFSARQYNNNNFNKIKNQTDPPYRFVSFFIFSIANPYTFTNSWV